MPRHGSFGSFARQSSGRSLFSLPAVASTTLAFARHLHGGIVAACISVMMIMPNAPACAQPTAMRPIARVASTARITAFIAEASRRFEIPAAWISAVMRAESFGDVHATSPKGAMGLMQIMPDTWAALRRRYHLGSNPYDAHDNIIAGAAYLRELHDRYGIPGFLAAYNAGPTRWEDHFATGRPLPAETRAYLAKLAPIVDGNAINDATLLAAVARSWTEAWLFPKQPSDRSKSATETNRPLRSGKSNITPPQDWTGLAPQSEGLFAVTLSAGRSR